MIEGIDVRIRYAKEAGIPDAMIMALVGHESLAMSARYTHVGKEALSRAAESLPQL